MQTATHVYVLSFSDGVIKVGRTSNPSARRASHAQTARIRRAVIVDEWWLEHELAPDIEGRLINLGRLHLEHLTGEYFSGNFKKFMKKVTRSFERCGLLPADRLTFDEVIAEFGVSDKDLLEARLNGALRIHRQISTPRPLYLRTEVQRWFDRYGLEERVWRRAADIAWNKANRGGVLEEAKRRQHLKAVAS